MRKNHSGRLPTPAARPRILEMNAQSLVRRQTELFCADVGDVGDVGSNAHGVSPSATAASDQLKLLDAGPVRVDCLQAIGGACF